MSDELLTLVEDARALTGSAAPALLDANAPVLQATGSEAIYLVGLIGGKDVGKSSLVNALVGQQISEQSDSGPGTEMAIAYAHRSATAELKTLLESIVPGKYRIIPHDVATLRTQVLVDLPDIDSHWQEHVALTRKMLRHMLYPIWIQSVEKYADRQPQTLLKQVAAGNDPSNFLFCLNKCDQLSPEEAKLLNADFARRLQQSLGSDELSRVAVPPRVYLLSATHPATLDLPEVQKILSNQKPEKIVHQSQDLARRRHDQSLLKWLENQRLGDRAERSRRLLTEAEELLAQRLAVPLLEEMIPRLMSDPGYRLSIVEPVVHARLSRWPVVNVLHTALLPLAALVQRNLGEASPELRVKTPALRGAFAFLQRTHPNFGNTYNHRRLWDDLPADMAEADLRQRLTAAIERQRSAACDKIAGGSILLLPIRWLTTIGAVLWFPIVQPVLAAFLAPGWTGFSREAALLVVQLLAAAYLIKTVGFLLIYFAVLWALLRWDTYRRVNRLLKKFALTDADPTLSLSGQALGWIDDLLSPLRLEVERANELVDRIEKVRGLSKK